MKDIPNFELLLSIWLLFYEKSAFLCSFTCTYLLWSNFVYIFFLGVKLFLAFNGLLDFDINL
jgi:hypothetical protein